MRHQRYIQRAFNTLREFSHRKHVGLTVGLGPEYAIRAVSVDLREHPANSTRYIRPGIEKLFSQYRDVPVLFQSAVYDVYDTWSNHEDHDDRILGFDTQGHLIEIEGFFVPGRELILQVSDFDADRGTRRWSCAGASCFNGVTTIALSERGSIVTYSQGRAVESLTYSPRRLSGKR